ncbi:Phosphatidylinositol 4-kinase [Babesia sp. Xinjiang]|uniref:Phosphatidylinositol 4-kinase n=1 Tax=Babesia sp. Xinjiang TaxID=462227 RepID=UPI000A23C5E7|nr:Phosphatidylinositol 4-kinase [Babesia sp. Xinjiang]ORM39510.1 Phosphatidylinositol 4-kinase [Babesia sp. Xinjiang]
MVDSLRRENPEYIGQYSHATDTDEHRAMSYIARRGVDYSQENNNYASNSEIEEMTADGMVNRDELLCETDTYLTTCESIHGIPVGDNGLSDVVEEDCDSVNLNEQVSQHPVNDADMTSETHRDNEIPSSENQSGSDSHVCDAVSDTVEEQRTVDVHNEEQSSQDERTDQALSKNSSNQHSEHDEGSSYDKESEGVVFDTEKNDNQPIVRVELKNDAYQQSIQHEAEGEESTIDVAVSSQVSEQEIPDDSEETVVAAPEETDVDDVYAQTETTSVDGDESQVQVLSEDNTTENEEQQTSLEESPGPSDVESQQSKQQLHPDSEAGDDYGSPTTNQSMDSTDGDNWKTRSTPSDDNNSVQDVEPKQKLFNISRKSSRKRVERTVFGTSENPIDITDLTVDSGSLLQLYQNDYFDAYMHMYHLYHKKEAGVHEYLVNLLYSKRTDQEVMFYLPQLCQLSISKYGKSSLHRFLLDRASTSMHFALRLSWFYQAIISDQASKMGHLAQKLTQETEMAVVNCKLISPLSNCAAPTEDRELNLCSKGLLLRRTIIRAIRAGHEGDFNATTDIEALERPKVPDQMTCNAMTLICPHSKVKLFTPYAKIGNPVDIEIHPYVECPGEIQYELERLMMKQRRLDYFNMLSNFVKLCMDVSKQLTSVAKRDARLPLLTLFAKSMNEWLLVQRCVVSACEESFAYRGLSLPMRKMGRDRHTNIPFQFLRIVEDELKIFLSKKRAPFVFYFEIANLDEDVRNISRGERGQFIETVTFRDLYVYEAIVKDLVASGLLDVADVSYIRNPLECIRYTMGMLPADVLERYNDRKDQFKSGPADSWRGGDDESAAALLSAIQGLVIGSNNKSFQYNRDDNRVFNKTPSAVETKFPLLEQMSPKEAKAVVFSELFEDKKKRLRKYSPYGKLESWNVRAVIIKGGDDLRQEYMVNQLLTLFNEIFTNARLPLWLRPIEILVTGPNCGIIEFLHDTCSVDVVKRKFNVDSIARAFERIYADKIYEARKNFIESHAAYSIVSYLLQVRDRHNGNILLDSEGHVIHIDYGFCLSNTPGNISFETSPFKLTKEYVDVMGGETSDNFDYFKALVIRGLLEARKHMDRIVLLVEMMTDAYKMPCFAAGTTYTMDMLKERFMLNLSEDVCIDRIVAMIEESLNNFTTVQYDNFQRLTNGINDDIDPEDGTFEEVDNLEFRKIDESIEKLDFVSLSAFDANVDLQSAIEHDAYIINNVVTRVGISKALTHGVKLSSIIKAKALRLNEVTTQELLGVVLELYCKTFAAEDTGPRQVQDDEKETNYPALDFTKLSKFFSSKAFGYSPLSWSTLPLPADEERPTPQPVKRVRIEEPHVPTPKVTRKELAPMLEYSETLEVQKHTEIIKNKLLEVAQDEPVSFWDFVLDSDPKDGYNQTCQNIYSLTFLIVRGFAAFTKDEQDVLLRGIEEASNDKENAQGIVTALSYEKWQEMIGKRNLAESQGSGQEQRE